MNQLTRRNEPVPTLYFLATLEILASMLQARNDTPGITSEEHDQFFAVKKRLSNLVKSSLSHSVSPSALQTATEHLNRVHSSIGSFVAKSNSQLKSDLAEIDSLWSQNTHITRWTPDKIRRQVQSELAADSGDRSLVPDSDMNVSRKSIEEWIAKYLTIRDRMTASISSILTEAEDIVEKLGRPFGQRANPAARLGVDPESVRDTDDEAENPLENLQHEIDRFGISIGQIGLDPGLSFFIQVSHDLNPNDVSMSDADISELSALCERIHTTVEGYERTISTADGCRLRLNLLDKLATDTAWIDAALKLASSHGERRDQQSKDLQEITTTAKRGDVGAAAETLKDLPRIYDLPYANVEKSIVEQKAILTRIQGLFADSEDELQKLEQKRTGTTAGKVLDWLGGDFDETELEQALIKACETVRKLKWDRQSENMKQVLDLIREAEPRCEYCGILLRWIPARPSVDEAVAKLKPRELPAEDAAFNALCAIAASDGSFCAEEKQVVRKICERAKLDRSTEEVAQGIKSWLQSARDNGLTTTLAQSVVDVKNVKGTRLAKVLPKALTLVADADDERDEREEIFLKRVLKRL